MMIVGATRKYGNMPLPRSRRSRRPGLCVSEASVRIVVAMTHLLFLLCATSTMTGVSTQDPPLGLDIGGNRRRRLPPDFTALVPISATLFGDERLQFGLEGTERIGRAGLFRKCLVDVCLND